MKIPTNTPRKCMHTLIALESLCYGWLLIASGRSPTHRWIYGIRYENIRNTLLGSTLSDYSCLLLFVPVLLLFVPVLSLFRGTGEAELIRKDYHIIIIMSSLSRERVHNLLIRTCCLCEDRGRTKQSTHGVCFLCTCRV